MSMYVLGVEGSGTPIEAEWSTLRAALARCARGTTTFDAVGHSSAAIAQATRMWTLRMEAEHRSTAVFAAMATQLMEANATLDAKAVVLRMAQDELRHTELCAEVVRALGGDPRCTVQTNLVPLARHPGRSPEERALRNVIYGCCLSETVNAARFVDALETIGEPLMRDATRLLLADERLHSQFGFFYLEAWRPWLDAHPDVRGSIERYLRHAFVIFERELSGVGHAPAPMTDEERALGLPDRQRLPETFYATVEHAIVPGLERFGIDAGTSWKRRALEGAPAAPMP